jgi:hypothetical protein
MACEQQGSWTSRPNQASWLQRTNQGAYMRVMEIPSFPRRIEIADGDRVIRGRLSQKIVLWPQQAIPLAGYACHPNDEAARTRLVEVLWGWSEGIETAVDDLPRIQHEWLRPADVLHSHLDLAAGRHQQRRRGASIGKAITLTAKRAVSWGTSEANLWRHWTMYKDVAHLVTAAVFICSSVRDLAQGKPFGPSGLEPNQFGPFQMIMLMPDLVLAIALHLQQHGLESIPHSRCKPAFDPETHWQIPSDINVTPIPLPARPLTKEDLKILNARRAGNRGKAN